MNEFTTDTPVVQDPLPAFPEFLVREVGDDVEKPLAADEVAVQTDDDQGLNDTPIVM